MEKDLAMDLETLKQQIRQEVERYRSELIDLSLRIHANPELGYEEAKASKWLGDFLAENRFQVETGFCGLPTAFRASYGRGRPVVAMLAEYDALPDVGHGCAHNILGTLHVGAGLAARPVVDQAGGTVVVIGSPAAEKLGSKVTMLNQGAFEGVDVALQAHPRMGAAPVGSRFVAGLNLEVEYWGKAAHAATGPWLGISALDALILAINNVNGLRCQMRDGTRVAYIITDGGKAANLVPEHAAGVFTIRAPDTAILDDVAEKLVNCLNGAAVATGTRLEHRMGLKIQSSRNNTELIRLWTENMRALGRTVAGIQSSSGAGDIGNVSQALPTLLSFISMSPEDLPHHTREWTAIAEGEKAHEALVDGAVGLAMVAADIITQPEVLARIKEEFQDKGTKP
ncbi:MAG: amidohydrolase [Chloroflexi bacterium]|nr:amidohydrolase [Chloroflexota bacterium]